MPPASQRRDEAIAHASGPSLWHPAAAYACRHPALATFALLALLGVAVFWDFLLGPKLYLFEDVGGDALTLFYPRFVHVADYLRSEGLPGWSFSQGFGQDIRPFSLGDPFAWILYAAGAERVAHAMAAMELAKLVAAGCFFGAALRSVGFRSATAAAGAVLYAFSGLMVVGSGWIVFSTYGVQLALILWGFERFWMHGRPWVFPLAIAACAAFNPATLAPFAVIGTAWALLRMAESERRGLRRSLRSAWALLGLAVLGLLLSAWLSIGVLLNLAESPRGSSEASHADVFASKSVLDVIDREQLAAAAARMYSSDLLGTGDAYAGWYNYLEAPLFYCGLVTLVLFGLSFALPDRRQRRLRVGFALVALAPVFFPFFRYAAWFFTGNYYRQFSLLVVLALLYPALRALDAILAGFRPRTWQVVASVGIPIALLAVVAWTVDGVDPRRALRIGGLLAVYGIAVAAASRPRTRAPALTALAIVVCVEAVAFGRTSMADRPTLEKSELDLRVGYNDHSLEAVRHARSLHPGFHRINKNYGSAPTPVRSRNDAKVQGYFGTTSYYSFNQIYTIRFLAELGFLDIASEPETRWTDGVNRAPGMSGLLSVRYSLLRDHPNLRPNPTLRKIAQFDDVGLYENLLFVPLGSTYDRVIPEPALHDLDTAGRRLALQRAAAIDPSESPEAIAALRPLTASEIVSELPQYDLAAARQDVSRLTEDTVAWASIAHNLLRGRIDLERTKLVFLSIPFDRGWRAEVDGAAAKLIRTNIGFLGLLLPAGSHAITLRYEPRFGRAAAATSLLGLALYALGLRRFSGIARRGSEA